MTIDERLEKLTERHEALAQSLEIVAGMQRENEEKTSAVHFLRFELTREMREALRAGAGVVMGSDHPAYRATAELAPEVRSALGADLT